MPAPQQTEFIARALILHHSHVLMCRSVSGNYLYLPGGHINFAEPAQNALIRELQEEANLKIAVGPLLLTTESTFNDGQSDHHELTLIFRAELQNQLFHMEQLATDPSQPLPNEPAASENPVPAARAVGDRDSESDLPRVVSAESHINFVWVDLASATDLDIRPPEIKAWLMLGGDDGHHLANFDPAIGPRIESAI
ncbi:MAG: NUDIX domain-containing protein [Phycisphaerales bacterium]